MTRRARRPLLYASFGQRTAAFLIDVIPITVLVATVFYVFLGFDETLNRYLEQGRQNAGVRAQFLAERNTIREVAGLAYVVYASIMQSTSWQATVGKRLIGIRVIDKNHRTMSFLRSLARSMTLLLSIVPAFIGCIAMLFSKTGRTWHDRAVNTDVVIGRSS